MIKIQHHENFVDGEKSFENWIVTGIHHGQGTPQYSDRIILDRDQVQGLKKLFCNYEIPPKDAGDK